VDVGDDRDLHLASDLQSTAVLRRLRVPLAVLSALVVAQAAALLLRPRDGVIAPAPVDAGSYFSEGQLDRARDFRGPQRTIFLGTLVLELGVLGWLVARPPRLLRGPFRRPVLAAVVTGAAMSVLLDVAPLPLRAVAHQRAKDVGLATQGWVDWGGDLLRAGAIGTVLGGAGGAAAVWLMRRSPRRWWLPGSAVVIGFAAITVYAGPIVIDPIFNKFQKLPEGRTRADVLELARRAGVDVGQVYAIDASRRTTGANAYVTGLGHTKRVVLYDNLLKDFSRDEVRLVVAHELGHVHYRDVARGLLYVALVAPVGLFAASLLTRRLAPDEPRPGPAALPALALSVAIVSFGVTVVANQLSRRIEARADSYSLRLTDAPEPFIGFERGISVRNVSDPDPPQWLVALLATHPPTVDRIGIAKAFEAGAR
jgi:Zn-dependent protease with chaperone function